MADESIGRLGPEDTVFPGARFHRLEVIEYAGKNQHGAKSWLCRCDCGNKKNVLASSLHHHRTLSCGCWKVKVTTERNTVHGQSKRQGMTPEYYAWVGLKQRATNPNCVGADNYSGRGITVCDRWLHSFQAFFSDMGPRPSSRHSVDRINNDGNYEPSNCRWATKTQQCENQRRARMLEFRGETLNLSEIARRTGLKYLILFRRLKRGWNLERAVSTPVKMTRKAHKFEVVNG